MPSLLVDRDVDLLNEWQGIANLADARQGKVLARVAAWWERLPTVLRALVLDLGVDTLVDQLDEVLWSESRSAQDALARDFADEAVLAASSIALPPTTGPIVDTATLRAESWARVHAANLVTGINATQEAAIRQMVVDSLEMGTGTSLLAERLATTSVGLTPQYVVAVDNYRGSLMANGTPPGIADAMARDYAARLRASRMELIARTETFRAMNQGRLALWRAAVNNGDLPRDVTKQWLTAEDERVCPHCGPLDALEVPLEADFESFTKHGATDAPPLHPNCRCVLVLTDPRGVERSNLWRRTRDLPPITPGQRFP